MAEEKKGQKWEGPGKPEGPGGESTQESADEAEGRKKKSGMRVCWNCGAGCYCGDGWEWWTCWRCGALNYNPKES
jgi:hypothetical protein